MLPQEESDSKHRLHIQMMGNQLQQSQHLHRLEALVLQRTGYEHPAEIHRLIVA